MYFVLDNHISIISSYNIRFCTIQRTFFSFLTLLNEKFIIKILKLINFFIFYFNHKFIKIRFKSNVLNSSILLKFRKCETFCNFMRYFPRIIKYFSFIKSHLFLKNSLLNQLVYLFLLDLILLLIK
mgnify:CR=1 FL=1